MLGLTLSRIRRILRCSDRESSDCCESDDEEDEEDEGGAGVGFLGGREGERVAGFF